MTDTFWDLSQLTLPELVQLRERVSQRIAQVQQASTAPTHAQGSAPNPATPAPTVPDDFGIDQAKADVETLSERVRGFNYFNDP